MNTDNILPLPFVVLDEPVIIDGERRMKLLAGMKVNVTDGRIVDCYGCPTHIINACTGTFGGANLELTLTDISTNIPVTIKL